MFMHTCTHWKSSVGHMILSYTMGTLSAIIAQRLVSFPDPIRACRYYNYYIHYLSDGLETLRYRAREIFAILVTPGSSLGNIWLQVTCVVEHMELPDLLKTAISSACSSGRKLSWKIQECEKFLIFWFCYRPQTDSTHDGCAVGYSSHSVFSTA